MQQENMSSIRNRMSLYFDQLAVLVSTDFKLKYNSTALGFLWSVLAPTAQAAVYFLVFSNVARFDIPDYFLYMISGMFFWHFFTSCLQISRKCFVTHGALIKKTNFNRSLLIVGMTMTEFLHLLLVIPILLLIMLGYALTRLKVWDEHFLKIANNVCFKCLLPVLLFYNVASANIFEVFNGKLILYACLCACILCGALFLIVPLFI